MFGFGTVGQRTIGESGLTTTGATVTVPSFTANLAISTQATQGVGLSLSTTLTDQTS